jgi:Uma2 family endonuclease
MAMPVAPDDWTLERVHALPDDGNRYELLDGELLVTPAPSWQHQTVLLALYRVIHPFVEASGALGCLIAPAAVTFSQRRELQPDLFVFPVVPGQHVTRFEDVGHLVLAVEVLSPDTARVDRYRKRAVYQEEGVDEYWIVDASARMIERWRPGDVEPEVVLERLEWQPLAAHSAFSIDLQAIFGASGSP